MYISYGKRLFDYFLSTITLIIIAPILSVIAMIVYLKIGKPIIFKQIRPGLHEKPFVMYKFRTMTDDHDEKGNLLSDSERLTTLGSFLRKTSLDELPEFWNVFKGDMSLVGPRPLLLEYLPYYTKREQCRHSVKPGITGLSQINGRNFLLWDERLEMDVQYVEKLSFFIDIQILIQTLIQVFVQKDVVAIPRTIGQPLSIYRSSVEDD